MAQKLSTIKIKVTDSGSGVTVLGAMVQLQHNTRQAQSTDTSGVSVFSLVAPCKTKLTVSHISYIEFFQEYTILGDTCLTIALNQQTEMLNASVVTARSGAMLRSDAAGKLSINTEKIAQLPSLTGTADILKSLQLMPGVQNSGEANGYIYVRGADPGHNSMLYANAPVYGMSHLLGIFPFYNADHASGVQFDKSGLQAKSGNALSSTIDIITQTEIPTDFSVKGNVGLLASQASISAPIGKKAGFVLSGRQTYTDQIITPLINSDSKDDIEDIKYSFTDFNFTFLAKPTDKHDISVDLFMSGDRFKISEDEFKLDGRLNWGNSVASLNWAWQPNDKLKIKQNAFYSNYHNKLDVKQASVKLDVKSSVVNYGYNGGAEFSLFNIPFEAGLQANVHHINPQQIISNELGLDNVSRTNNRTNSFQLAFYAQAKPQLNAFWHFDLGVRVGMYKSTGSNTHINAEPRISLHYNSGNRMNAHIAYTRKYQYLSLITTSSVGFPTDFWIATSHNLPVQNADGFSAGAEYRLSRQFQFSGNLYYSSLKNLMEYPYSILQFNEINSFVHDMKIGNGKAYGAELMLRKTGRLNGWISYTLSKSDRKFVEINNGETYPTKFDRRHNLSIVAMYKLSEKWSVGATQVYSSGSRFTTPVSWYFINNNPVKEYGALNNAKMPDYMRTDISVDFYLKKTTKKESVLNLSIYNAFAVKNPIYVTLGIKSDSEGKQVVVNSIYKYLYSILPSISWRFKF